MAIVCLPCRRTYPKNRAKSPIRKIQATWPSHKCGKNRFTSRGATTAPISGRSSHSPQEAKARRAMQGARTVKGMVSVAGRSYRIVRIGSGHYAVFRILDDLQVGTFRTQPTFDIWPEQIDAPSLLAVAREAIHAAKTSWVGRLHGSEGPQASAERPERVGARSSSDPPPNPTPT